MEYQFAIIKSKYTFKKKRILTISSIIMDVVVILILMRFLIISELEQGLLIFFLSLAILKILSFLFLKFVIDNCKIAGTIIFDSGKLAILPENIVLKIENINHIYYGYSSLDSYYRRSHSSYFLQIEPKTGESIYLNLIRNPHNGKKFTKRNFFKWREDIFYVFKELKISHSFKKPKNFLIQR